MTAHTPKLQIDECEDSRGFLTLRPFDGTPSGNIDVQPIATVYGQDHAAYIVAAANAYPLLQELADVLERYVDADGDDDDDDDDLYRTARAVLEKLEATK